MPCQHGVGRCSTSVAVLGEFHVFQGLFETTGVIYRRIVIKGLLLYRLATRRLMDVKNRIGFEHVAKLVIIKCRVVNVSKSHVSNLLVKYR